MMKRRRLRSGQPSIQYRSRYEESLGTYLAGHGIPFYYEKEKFSILVPGTTGHACGKCGAKTILRTTSYTPDFFLPVPRVYVETKGKLDARGRKALLAFKAQYPHARLIVLFQKDNWVTKSHKHRYSEWADMNNIEWAVGNGRELLANFPSLLGEK
jgi:hypothetical protein